MPPRRADRDVLDAIEAMALRGLGPASIDRELARDPATSDRAPTLRTIQRIVRETRPQDDSGPWHLSPDDPDPATVLWVLAASLRDGWRLPITALEARWIVVLHRAVPDVGPLTTRYLARMYMAAESRGEPTTWLDSALAIAPWRGPDERRAYEALGLPRLAFAMSAQQAVR